MRARLSKLPRKLQKLTNGKLRTQPGELTPRTRGENGGEQRGLRAGASSEADAATAECAICLNQCIITLDPWERTRSALSAVTRRTNHLTRLVKWLVRLPTTQPCDMPGPYGIELRPCRHCFCGICLAQTIYHSLDVVFDPLAYGTKVQSCAPVTPLRFPIPCPTCQITIKQGEVAVEIDDTVAKLVLGEANMDEWNDARFLATHNIIYCPFTGCGKAFDTDISSSRDQARVQCPDCSRSICQVCKTVWHENMTCQVYQAIPISERVPDDAALLDLAKQLNWRQCPKCYAWPMELKHGCNHTICIICRHHFCYTCGADFDYTGGKYRCRGGEACRVWEDL